LDEAFWHLRISSVWGRNGLPFYIYSGHKWNKEIGRRRTGEFILLCTVPPILFSLFVPIPGVLKDRK
jgi:hypothetical protein